MLAREPLNEPLHISARRGGGGVGGEGRVEQNLAVVPEGVVRVVGGVLDHGNLHDDIVRKSSESKKLGVKRFKVTSG